MYLFLQGEKNIGKSYLLRQAFLPYSPLLCGYTVQRLYRRGRNGCSHAGFRVCLLEGDIPAQDAYIEESYDGADAFIFQGRRNSLPLELAIAKVAQACRGGKARLVLLDEIGGIELKSKAFMANLEAVLHCGLPVVGVFKSLDNLRSTMHHTGLDDEYLHLHARLKAILEEKSDILTLTTENATVIMKHISGFIEANNLHL